MIVVLIVFVNINVAFCLCSLGHQNLGNFLMAWSCPGGVGWAGGSSINSTASLFHSTDISVCITCRSFYWVVVITVVAEASLASWNSELSGVVRQSASPHQ